MEHCIFAFDNERCQPNDSHSFLNIMCRRHMNEVYGLDVTYDHFENENQSVRIGPFLSVVPNWSFKSGDVILPEKYFVDMTYEAPTTEQLPTVGLRMNPKIVDFIQRQCQPSRSNKKATRYMYEIIRNINAKEVEPFDTTSDMALTNLLQRRLNNVNTTITNSKISRLFPGIKSETDKNDFEGLNPFYQLMVSNMHINEFTYNSNVHVEKIQANVEYRKGVGFVALKTITHPLSLVCRGQITTDRNYYNTKVVVFQKTASTKCIQKQCYPDNNNIMDVLKGVGEYRNKSC